MAAGGGAGAICIETDPATAPRSTRACGNCTTTATAARIDAERALNRRLGGSCQVPIGALAEIDGEPCTWTAWSATQKVVACSPPRPPAP